MMSTEWSRWIPIAEAPGYCGPAVYRLRIVAADGPVSIPRFLAVDTEGILSIGSTSDMDQRRLDFQTGLRSGRGHSQANLLHIVERETALGQLVSAPAYQYTFVRLPSTQQATHSEEMLIKAYVCIYGELPPLNSSIANRYEPDSWSRARGAL
jgi:hypothetical protein